VPQSRSRPKEWRPGDVSGLTSRRFLGHRERWPALDRERRRGTLSSRNGGLASALAAPQRGKFWRWRDRPLCRCTAGGRESVVLATARNLLGRPLAGVLIRARGAGVNYLARTNQRGIARFIFTAPRLGIIRFRGANGLRTTPITRLGCQHASACCPRASHRR